MSETSEMPIPQEVVEPENPVVKAARAGVRGALETNKAWRDYRDTLHVKTEKKSVYRAWVDAADNVVGSMTKADQEKTGTKLYEVKMRLAAGAFFMASTPLDIAVNVLSWIPRKGLMVAGGIMTMIDPPLGMPVLVSGYAMERAVAGGFTRKIGIEFAKMHTANRVLKYKVGETKEAVKLGREFMKEQVNGRVRQIVEGFAYPEGKPVKPPMAKV